MEPRMKHAMTIWRNKIIIYGGKGENNRTLQDLWSFDLDSREWCRVCTSRLIFTTSCLVNSYFHQCQVMTVFAWATHYTLSEVLKVCYFMLTIVVTMIIITIIVIVMFRIVEKKRCILHFCIFHRFIIRSVVWLIVFAFIVIL